MPTGIRFVLVRDEEKRKKNTEHYRGENKWQTQVNRAGDFQLPQTCFYLRPMNTFQIYVALAFIAMIFFFFYLDFLRKSLISVFIIFVMWDLWLSSGTFYWVNRVVFSLSKRSSCPESETTSH